MLLPLHAIISVLLAKLFSSSGVSNQYPHLNWHYYALQSNTVERWETYPPTPSLPIPMTSSYAPVNGIKLWYATFPTPTKKLDITPIFFLHASFTNSDYWGLQVDELRRDYHVYVVDWRAQGRSEGHDESLTYPDMTNDFIALLDYLKIEKASIVGWSDGAINAMDLLINHPKRLSRVFAFAQNFEVAGIIPNVTTTLVFEEYISRAVNEFERLAPNNANSTKALEKVINLWTTQRAFTEADFRGIDIDVGKCTWIVAGDRDEIVQRNQSDLAGSWIPAAGLVVIPQTSHFAFLQAPRLFNSLLRNWLKNDACHR